MTAGSHALRFPLLNAVHASYTYYLSERPVPNSFARSQTSRKSAFRCSSQRSVTTPNGIGRPPVRPRSRMAHNFWRLKLGLWHGKKTFNHFYGTNRAPPKLYGNMGWTGS